MRIPEIRTELHTISKRIEELAEELKRRPATGRGTVGRSRRISAIMRTSIKTLARTNPKATHQWIAKHFGVNPGRISEVLNGKRN